MAVLLPGSPGIVIALQDPAAQALLPLVNFTPAITGTTSSGVYSLAGSLFHNSNSSVARVLITAVALSETVNQQIMHTLGGAIYLYVFGDRVSQVTFSGVCSAGGCANGDGTHGVELVRSWYNKYKASASTALVSLLIGRQTTVTGIINGFNTSVTDPSTQLMQFAMQMQVLPGKASAATK